MERSEGDSNDELRRNEERKVGRVSEEVKKQLWLSTPLIGVSLLQFSLQLISLMFVGHLGSLPLSAASMATSFASITGFSLLIGTASALDTLCGQSYGAKAYNMLGIHVQRAMLVLLIICIPLSIICSNTEHFLLFLHQDKSIAKNAGSYAMFMIPGLFAYALLQCFNKFLQAQNNVLPLVLCSAITTLHHVVLCWFLVLKSGLGHKGAALANSVSYWVNVVLLSCYVQFSSSCSQTWTGFSMEALHDILSFIKLAVPSAVMVCLEMWSFELLVLLSGLLPNPILETSVLSICLNTVATIWMISYGLSGAASTRISNELGAGNAEATKQAVRVVIIMAILEGIVVGSALFLIRNIWGHAYSKEAETIRYVAKMMPILALSNFLVSLQCVLSGIARGCGWQKVGAFVNLGSYYLVGIPTALFFGFLLHLRDRGLWLGIICTLIVQVLVLSFITIHTNWEEEAKIVTETVGLTNTEDMAVDDPISV